MDSLLLVPVSKGLLSRMFGGGNVVEKAMQLALQEDSIWRTTFRHTGPDETLIGGNLHKFLFVIHFHFPLSYLSSLFVLAYTCSHNQVKGLLFISSLHVCFSERFPVNIESYHVVFKVLE